MNISKKPKPNLNKHAFIFLILLFCFPNNSSLYGQKANSLIISNQDFGNTIGEFTSIIKSKYDIKIFYEDENDLRQITADSFRSINLAQYLKIKFKNKSIISDGEKSILVLNNSDFFNSEKFSVIIVSGINNQIFAKVVNADNNENKVGAYIYCPELKFRTITDNSGVFRIKSSNKIVKAVISFLGYERKNVILVADESKSNSIVNIPLKIDPKQFEAVVISANKSDVNVRSQIIGVEKLQIEMIKAMPTFLGDIDPIKSITALPGVSSVGDISAGYNVRGGENSQNLILQDGTIIFNPTHLFGFFSAFNPELINDIVLLKGGGPAKFGGRVSSILEIQTKNGNLNQIEANGSVGLISSRLTVEGPIVKHKASILLGARYSYSNWFIHSYENVQLKNSFANFNDLSGKLYFQINKNNFISASGYNSFDSFSFNHDSIYSWETTNFSIKWDHIFSEKLKGFLVAARSYYTSGLGYDDRYFGYNYKNKSDIYSLNYRMKFDVNDKLKFEFGWFNNFNKLSPGESLPTSEESNYIAISLPNSNSLESSLSVDSDYDLNKKFAFSIGLRYSQFFRVGGPSQFYVLSSTELDGRSPLIIDTLNFKRGELFSDYGGLEPRLSLRYMINNSTSLKVSFNKMRQYIHLISTTTSPSPIDFNIASSPNIKPQISEQYSFGVFKNLKNNRYEVSIESFYKKIKNSIEYIEGIDLNLNTKLEAGLIQGKGIAYGTEVLIKKKQGRFNGWIAYTYSRSFKLFNSLYSPIVINDGNKFLSMFDQPHQLTVIFNYQLNPSVSFSSNFVYNTGRPITIPIGKYSYDKFLSINSYSNRNEYRMPDYHRLDISAKIKTRKLPGKKISGEWIFSVFNLYGRKNAFAIYFNQGAQAYKTSIIGTIVPSISYNFKFD
jgi:hypothetical protein